jgi:hypothetical protein
MCPMRQARPTLLDKKEAEFALEVTLCSEFAGAMESLAWVESLAGKKHAAKAMHAALLSLTPRKRGQEPLCEAPEGPFRQRFLTPFPRGEGLALLTASVST